jgi:hypothetical protein
MAIWLPFARWPLISPPPTEPQTLLALGESGQTRPVVASVLCAMPAATVWVSRLKPYSSPASLATHQCSGIGVDAQAGPHAGPLRDSSAVVSN